MPSNLQWLKTQLIISSADGLLSTSFAWPWSIPPLLKGLEDSHPPGDTVLRNQVQPRAGNAETADGSRSRFWLRLQGRARHSSGHWWVIQLVLKYLLPCPWCAMSLLCHITIQLAFLLPFAPTPASPATSLLLLPHLLLPTGVLIIAEPGRYFAEASSTMICPIYGVRDRPGDAEAGSLSHGVNEQFDVFNSPVRIPMPCQSFFLMHHAFQHASLIWSECSQGLLDYIWAL